MKLMFLRNCTSKDEYLYFLKKCTKQFEEYECKIIKELILEDMDYLDLINNLRISKSFFTQLKFDSIIDNNVANVIRIVNKQTHECFFTILNGHNYSKYSAF